MPQATGCRRRSEAAAALCPEASGSVQAYAEAMMSEALEHLLS
jgi:hypothetical protein